jgi:hypothetical protein
MPTCNEEESRENRHAEKLKNDQRQANGKPRIVHGLVNVTVEANEPDALVFTTRGEDGNKHSYRLSKDLIYPKCPTTALEPRERGTLVISKKGLEVQSNDSDMTRIYGTTPDANGQTLLEIKWPDPGLAATIQELSIWPTSIIVAGYALDDPDLHSGEVDLLDGNLADFQQNISVDHGSEIKLRLTPIGLGAFNMAGMDEQSLRHALSFVKTNKVHRGISAGDLQERARCWDLIARWKRFLQRHEPRDDAEKQRQQQLLKEIDETLALAPA